MARTVQRTINDLFTVGRAWKLEVNDEPIVVWLQRLDPVDHEAATIKAKAARAKVRAMYHDPESDEMYVARDLINDATVEQLVDLVVSRDEQQVRDSTRAEVMLSEDSEWAKDGYLLGLFDSLQNLEGAGGDHDPDDPEVKQVIAELERYNQEVTELVEQRLADLRGQFADRTHDSLREQAIEAYVQQRCDAAWLDMFTAAELWLGVRKPCDRCIAEVDPAFDGKPHVELHDGNYFTGVDQVRRLPVEARGPLEAAFGAMHMGLEGKDSRATGSSSGSSEPSGQPEETSEPSGLAAASA